MYKNLAVLYAGQKHINNNAVIHYLLRWKRCCGGGEGGPRPQPPPRCIRGGPRRMAICGGLRRIGLGCGFGTRMAAAVIS